MTAQWGAPLTGAQMKLLRAAGLPDETEYQFQSMWSGQWQGGGRAFQSEFLGENYRLPADHAAYTLLEAGWLDGRNVALWFGGESWPNSWLAGSDIIRRDGTVEEGDHLECWRHNDDERDIIAYIRKAESLTTHADRVLADAERMAKRMGGKFVNNEHWGEAAKADEQTVTLAKMTEAEWGLRVNSYGMLFEDMRDIFCDLGLIKPEPTRDERFWQAQPNGGAHVTDDVKAWVRDALNFERSD